MTIIIRQVQDVSPFNFGLIVAYVVPGFVILCGFSFHSATVASWLAGPSQSAADRGRPALRHLGLGRRRHGCQHGPLGNPRYDSPPHGREDSRVGFLPLARSSYRIRVAGGVPLPLLSIWWEYAHRSALCLPGLSYVSGRAGEPVGGGGCRIYYRVRYSVLGSRDALRKYYRRAGALLSAK